MSKTHTWPETTAIFTGQPINNAWRSALAESWREAANLTEQEMDRYRSSMVKPAA